MLTAEAYCKSDCLAKDQLHFIAQDLLVKCHEALRGLECANGMHKDVDSCNVLELGRSVAGEASIQFEFQELKLGLSWGLCGPRLTIARGSCNKACV